MNYQDIELQQKEIFKQIYRSGDCNAPKPLDGILTEIRKFDAETITSAMGEMGTRLWKFSLSIDLNHPDLSNVFNGQLVGQKDGSFSKDAIDILNVIDASKAFNLSKGVLDAFKKLLKSHEQSKAISILGTPKTDQLFVRFAPKENRLTIRKTKKMQDISPRRGKEFWTKQPSGLSHLIRNSCQYQKIVDEANSAKKRFEDFGLTSMAGEVQKSIEAVKQKQAFEIHCGFNKVLLADAVINLGKMVGFEYLEDTSCANSSASIAYYTVFTTATSTTNAGVPPESAFVNIGPTQHSGIYAQVGSLKWIDFYENPSNIKPLDFMFNKVPYQPRAYPYHEVEHLASKDVKQLIEHIDCFPEMSGMPLFDHIRVMIPGFGYPYGNTKNSYHIEKLGKNYSRLVDARFAIDQMLIEEKKLVGAIFGERDGEHYFISYFM